MFATIIVSTVFFISMIVLIICYRRWCNTHKRPLTYDEIEKLSEKRIKKEIKRINSLVGYFESGHRYVKNTSFDPNGQLYTCNIKASEFPSYIASQLFGKKHEWIVEGMVCDGVVIKYWANKGYNSNSVCLSTSIENIIDICNENNCTALLDLHNHPNSNPNKYNCLLSSEADRRTSDIWSKELNDSGISLYSFICERGQWILYYRHLTDKLQKQPDFTTIEYIKNENGISELQNLKLHKELGIFHK